MIADLATNSNRILTASVMEAVFLVESASQPNTVISSGSLGHYRKRPGERGTSESIADWFAWRWLMPRYFFDIKDGHRLVDPSGSDWKNDAAAIEKARVLAIGVSLDKPAVDPKRRISVLNSDRVEISTVPVYSKPA